MHSDPRSMDFWAIRKACHPAMDGEWTPPVETCREQMERVCHHLRVDDSGDAPLSFQAPKYDLGHEEWHISLMYGPRVSHLVYATIDAEGRQTCRITAFENAHIRQ